MKTCKWVLQQILNILEKGVNTEQERDKILQLIETFKKRHLYIPISLEKFEELCTTACYNPEMLLEERKKSKCLRLLFEIEQSITREAIPLSDNVRRELIGKIKEYLNYIDQKYLRVGYTRFKEIEQESERLREEVKTLRDHIKKLEEENKKLRETVVSLYEEREILRKRVTELRESVRLLEKYDYSSIISRYRTLFEVYFSLAVSLANSVSRLLEENVRLVEENLRLRGLVEELDHRLREVEERLRSIEEAVRSGIFPERVKKRIIEELKKSLLQ